MKKEVADIALLASVAAFALDCVVNFYWPAAVYVASLPVLIVLLVRAIPSKKKRSILMLTIAVTALIFSVNGVRIGVTKDDVSDVLYLMGFFSAVAFSLNAKVNKSTVSLITFVLFLLFIPTFFGINAGAYERDALSSGSLDIEYFRLYNQGLYRLPHVAAYMMAFGCLWWLWLFSVLRKYHQILLSGLFFGATLYTGSRTPALILVFGAALCLWRLRPAFVVAGVGLAGILLAALINLDYLLEISSGTILYQYVSVFKTLFENVDRLSRVIIWTSWVDAMSGFNFADWIVGRTFAQSLQFNEHELGLRIWFHNEYMSILYSYGAILFCVYLVFTVKGLQPSIAKGSSRVLLMCGIFIVVAAFVNGINKYMPVLFFVMASGAIKVSSEARHGVGKALIRK